MTLKSNNETNMEAHVGSLFCCVLLSPDVHPTPRLPVLSITSPPSYDLLILRSFSTHSIHCFRGLPLVLDSKVDNARISGLHCKCVPAQPSLCNLIKFTVSWLFINTPTPKFMHPTYWCATGQLEVVFIFFLHG